MAKLIWVLFKLLVEGKSQLLDFEDVMSRYNKIEADKIVVRLKTLEEAEIIQFQREEFGFRVLVSNMGQLKKYNQIE